MFPTAGHWEETGGVGSLKGRKWVTDWGYAPDSVGGRAFSGDKALYEKIMENLNREPGFDEETKRNLYMLPAEQTKLEEAGALRRLNQGAVGAGSYAGGGRLAGRGEILAGGVRTRADLRRQAETDAAKVALQDRYDQLAQLMGYVDPRLEMSQRDTLARNQFNLGSFGTQADIWGTKYGQYYQNLEQSKKLLEKIVAAIMGGKTGGASGAMMGWSSAGGGGGGGGGMLGGLMGGK